MMGILPDDIYERAAQRSNEAVDRVYAEVVDVAHDYPYLTNAQHYQLAIENLLDEDSVVLSDLSDAMRAEIAYRSIPERQSPAGEAWDSLASAFRRSQPSPLTDQSQSRILQSLIGNFSPEYGGVRDHHNLHKYEFFSALRADPVIEDASVNWTTYSQEEKLEILERVHTLQARIYGYNPQTIQLYEPEANIMAGEHSAAENTIYIAVSHLNNSSFSDVIGTVMHEGIHAFDAQLIQNAVEIHEEEDRWLIENHITEMPLNPENYAAYRAHMTNWISTQGQLSYPDHEISPYQLILGGEASLRAHGLMLYAGSKVYVHAYESVDRYMDTPQERSAYAFSGKEDLPYLYADEAPLTYLGAMRDEAELARDRIVERTPEPFRQYQNNLLSAGLE